MIRIHAWNDATLGRVILFGGAVGFGEVPSDETWSYDIGRNAWTKLSPTRSPSARRWHDMLYADAARRIVLFGGGPDRNAFTNETWLFDIANSTWVGPSASGPSVGNRLSVVAGPVVAAVGVATLMVWMWPRKKRGKIRGG